MGHFGFSYAMLNDAHAACQLFRKPRQGSAMVRRSRDSTLASQPGNAGPSGKPRGNRSGPRTKRRPFAARPTIDVTPDLRVRMKIAAVERGVTVASMLRFLLLKAFPRTKGSLR
jgi:hypothetical protein